MSQKNFVAKNGLSVGNVVIDAATDTLTGVTTANVANINATGLVSLGNVANVKIQGGIRNQLLQTDGNGGLSWYSFNPDSGLSATIDVFQGDGETTQYPLSTTPVSENFTTVVIDGVTQLKTTYSLNNNVLTIGGALPANTRMEVTTLVGYGNSALSATVDTYIGNGNANTYQLTVTPPSIGSTSVVIDGITQMRNAYTIEDANIILSEALPASSVMEITTLIGANTQPNYANFSNEANIALTAYSVTVANVSGIGNIATVNLNGNSNTVLAGNGAWVEMTGGGGGSNTSNTANYANFAGQANTANTANTALSVAAANITGTVSFATNSSVANTANSISGSNVTGTVANATYALSANTANLASYATTANSVTGANVSGTVANATYATSAGTATSATSATTSGTVTANAQPNITSVGTLTSLTSNGNVSFTGANVSLGNVAKLHITGGNATQFLASTGNGNLDFVDFKRYTHEWHVDPYNGSDTNDGSAQYPFATMAYTLTQAKSTGELIRLHPGTYTDDVTVTQNNIDIVGETTAPGGLINYTGNFTVNQTVSSVRVKGISFGGNLTVASSNAITYLDDISVGGTLTKTSNQYVAINNAVLQGSGVAITGAGQTALFNSIVTNLTVNNASATVTVQSGRNVTYANNAAGLLVIKDSFMFSNATANYALVSAANSITYVYNTGIASPAGTVGRVNLAGYWSINGSQYDYANSTANALLNLQTVSYTDVISAGTVSATSLSGALTGNVTGTKFSNGNSNVTITSNGNISMFVAGNATARLVATSTGANIAGTANITGNLTAANASLGNVASANFFTGTLTTNAQPNITSTGTLTSLSVSGNITVTGNAGITMSNRIAFRVYGSGTTNNLTTTQNGNGQLNSNNYTVDYTQGSGFNSSTGTFTAPVAGLYSVAVNSRNSGYTGGISQIAIIKNMGIAGESVQVMVEWAANSSMDHAGGATITKLAANDTLTLRVLAGQVNFDGNDNWAVAYIG